MIIDRGLDYDDVLILPRLSNVNSRDTVDISTKLENGMKLRVPIIASPMKGIINADFVAKLSDYGIIGILHRFYDNWEARLADIKNLCDNSKDFGVAIGLDEVDSTITDFALDHGAGIICIDIANGYLSSLEKATSNLYDKIIKGGYNFTHIMTGNVVTRDGALRLHGAGADYIRVGIGSGALCTTRKVTGIGCPQLTALSECSDPQWISVSDGGIKSSGDIVKAMAFGADLIMLGSMLAKTEESAHNGIIYGMASKRLQEEYYHNTRKSIEGIEMTAEKTTPLVDLLDEISWGLKSACTYLGISKLKDIKHNVDFVITK